MERFGCVFLIPSDGISAAPQGQFEAMWNANTAGDGKDTFPLMASLSLSEYYKEHQSFGASTVVTEPKAVLGTESSNKSRRGAPVKPRLPMVDQVLMLRAPAVRQARNNMLGQTLQPQQQVAQRLERIQEEQKFGFSPVQRVPLNPHAKHISSQAAATPPVKSSGRGSQGEKSASYRNFTMPAGSDLALQSDLVTMLQLQEQGGLQRKPVFPKRNLLCMSFMKLGVCPNRETCNYVHNLSELQKKLELRKTSLCRYWLKGKCENEDCNFAHGKLELQSTEGVFKTTICKYWKQGCCYSGEFCRHAHGETDLRPENLPPHLERKKQKQQSRIVNRNSGQRRERAGGCGTEIWDGTFGMWGTKSDATFDRLHQIICNGIRSDSPPSVRAFSLDSLVAGVKSTKRWDTYGSNSSELSVDL